MLQISNIWDVVPYTPVCVSRFTSEELVRIEKLGMGINWRRLYFLRFRILTRPRPELRLYEGDFTPTELSMSRVSAPLRFVSWPSFQSWLYVGYTDRCSDVSLCLRFVPLISVGPSVQMNYNTHPPSGTSLKFQDLVKGSLKKCTNRFQTPIIIWFCRVSLHSKVT